MPAQALQEIDHELRVILEHTHRYLGNSGDDPASHRYVAVPKQELADVNHAAEEAARLVAGLEKAIGRDVDRAGPVVLPGHRAGAEEGV